MFLLGRLGHLRYTVGVALVNKLPQVSSSPTSTAAARSGTRGLFVTVSKIDTTRPGAAADLQCYSTSCQSCKGIWVVQLIISATHNVQQVPSI